MLLPISRKGRSQEGDSITFSCRLEASARHPCNNTPCTECSEDDFDFLTKYVDYFVRSATNGIEIAMRR
jgi:hypothetical protein